MSWRQLNVLEPPSIIVLGGEAERSIAHFGFRFGGPALPPRRLLPELGIVREAAMIAPTIRARFSRSCEAPGIPDRPIGLGSGMPSDQYWTLIGNDLVLLAPTEFTDENELQALVERYPELLARSIDDDPDSPGWLLVKREAGIKFDDGEQQTHWSLDHLYVDSEGIPTLVEVKRAADPRIRREVVAQLLDYAASFRADWDGQRLADAWTVSAGKDHETVMADFLAPTDFGSAHEFWETVNTQIAANNLRLLIVADELPPQLRRIIEYLNEQMEQTEVLGVEIRPRIGLDPTAGRSYSVSVVGDTQAAAIAKGKSERGTIEAFWEILRNNRGPDETAAVEALFTTLQNDSSWLTVGRGSSNPQAFVNYRSQTGQPFWPIAVRPKQGRVYLQLRWLAYRPGFEEEARRIELRDRMAEATGASLDTGQINGFPWFPTSVLVDVDRREGVVEVIRWAVSQIDAASDS